MTVSIESECIRHRANCHHCGQSFTLWQDRECPPERFAVLKRAASCNQCAYLFSVWHERATKLDELKQAIDEARREDDSDRIQRIAAATAGVVRRIAEVRSAFAKRTGGRTFERSIHCQPHQGLIA